jgi:hypothetical protein
MGSKKPAISDIKNCGHPPMLEKPEPRRFMENFSRWGS